MARRRKTRRASKSSAGCRCKIGSDGRKHCFKMVRGQIRGCKKR